MDLPVYLYRVLAAAAAAGAPSVDPRRRRGNREQVRSPRSQSMSR